MFEMYGSIERDRIWATVKDNSWSEKNSGRQGDETNAYQLHFSLASQTPPLISDGVWLARLLHLLLSRLYNYF